MIFLSAFFFSVFSLLSSESFSKYKIQLNRPLEFYLTHKFSQHKILTHSPWTTQDQQFISFLVLVSVHHLNPMLLVMEAHSLKKNVRAFDPNNFYVQSECNLFFCDIAFFKINLAILQNFTFSSDNKTPLEVSMSFRQFPCFQFLCKPLQTKRPSDQSSRIL